MSAEHFAKRISLRADEEMAAILHHHPISYAKQILITAVLILGAFFLMFELFSRGGIGVALFLAIFLIGVFYGSREFFIWYNNVFIITTDRVIDFDQKGFWQKTVSEVNLDKILDISYVVKGFKQTLFNLGTIRIKSSGADLLVKNIKEPAKVNQLMADLIREQTGKKIEIKEIKSQNGLAKDQLIDDFLNQDELARYDDFKLDELVAESRESLGEARLKKILVDELEKRDQAAKNSKNQDNKPGSDSDFAGNFKKKQL